ncbi:MAG: ABC transporter ATP-binding protein [Actinomycetota bacterium]|nr:MAG: ABC transporter ATP-binding protein [Actinomycetota bacterium]
MTTIEVNDLYIAYGEKIAVAGISLQAQSGEVLTILGPNGAGKTSTVESIEGYRKPSKGSIKVLGLDPYVDLSKLAPSIGVMLQNGGIYPRMTPLQALQLFHGYYKNPLEIEYLIKLTNLEGALKTSYRQLSGGEKQRLSLALAIIGRPKVVFLDEPTAGIDPEGRLAVREVIRNLKSQGVCVLLTTHELDEAQRLSDRIIILDHGKIVAEGSPEDLMTAAHGDNIRFSAPIGLNLAELASTLDAEVIEERAGEYLVSTAATPERIARLTSFLANRNIAIGDIRAGRSSLEDVFFALTGKEIEPEESPNNRRRSRRRR